MKKTVLTLSVLALLACSKDDKTPETPQAPAPSLVGKWQMQKITVLSGSDGKVILQETPDDCEKKGFTEFTADNKTGEISYSLSLKSTGVGTPSVMSCEQNRAQPYTPFEYNASTKKIILKTDTGSETADVLTLTATDLELSSVIDDLNKDGIADKATVAFTRIK